MIINDSKKRKKRYTQTRKNKNMGFFFTIVWMYLNSVYMCMFHMKEKSIQRLKHNSLSPIVRNKVGYWFNRRTDTCIILCDYKAVRIAKTNKG